MPDAEVRLTTASGDDLEQVREPFLERDRLPAAGRCCNGQRVLAAGDHVRHDQVPQHRLSRPGRGVVGGRLPVERLRSGFGQHQHVTEQPQRAHPGRFEEDAARLACTPDPTRSGRRSSGAGCPSRGQGRRSAVGPCCESSRLRVVRHGQRPYARFEIARLDVDRRPRPDLADLLPRRAAVIGSQTPMVEPAWASGRAVGRLVPVRRAACPR